MHRKLNWLVAAVIGLMAPVVLAATHQGVVRDTVSAGGYTYMQIGEGGETFWIAGPVSSISVGTEVTFSEQIWMSDFHSKALDRTFDRILFVAGVQPVSAAPTASSASTAPSVPTAELYTVEQVFAQRKALKGKEIAVRGRVAKVSTNIMNRTWVHIQDGTGGAGTDDLIFRSRGGSAAVGSTVVARGTVDIDRDFGMGYQYPVLVEDAVFGQ
jgi:hypothetical protein